MGITDKIKNSAEGNGTKFYREDELIFEKVLNNLFYLEKDIDEETRFVRHIMTRGAETQERVGLHASAMLVIPSKFCVRQQVLSLIYKQSQGEQIPVGLKRIFEEGNAIHEKWQRLFIRGGFSKHTDLDKTQYCEEYKMSFTPDIICEIDGYGKMVGEIKSVNSFQFKKMIHHPTAWKQLQWYMHLTGIHKGFVLSEDKNTQDIKVEIYEYDKEKVLDFIDRAETIMYHYNRVFEEHKMVKRPDDAKKPDCKRCRECFMREACWSIGKGKVRIGEGENEK